MLESIKESIGKLMEGTSEQAQIDVYAGIIKSIDESEKAIAEKDEAYKKLQSKYCDVVLHYPASDKAPESMNTEPKSLEDMVNDIVANRK